MMSFVEFAMRVRVCVSSLARVCWCDVVRGLGLGCVSRVVCMGTRRRRKGVPMGWVGC